MTPQTPARIFSMSYFLTGKHGDTGKKLVHASKISVFNLSSRDASKHGCVDPEISSVFDPKLRDL